MARNSMRFGFALGGWVEVRNLLAQLPEPLRNEVIPAMMGDVGREVVLAARSFAPVRSGALRRSITFVVRRVGGGGTRGKGKKARGAYAVIGPDKSYYAQGKRLKHREAGADRPAHYAHLVEFGTGTAAAHPFLRPAFISRRRQVAQICAAGLAGGIQKAVARMRKRAAKRGIKIS
jgi:HK97 gp10 family phage protein